MLVAIFVSLGVVGGDKEKGAKVGGQILLMSRKARSGSQLITSMDSKKRLDESDVHMQSKPMEKNSCKMK